VIGHNLQPAGNHAFIVAGVQSARSALTAAAAFQAMERVYEEARTKQPGFLCHIWPSDATAELRLVQC
jgi:hypothetical protein